MSVQHVVQTVRFLVGIHQRIARRRELRKVLHERRGTADRINRRVGQFPRRCHRGIACRVRRLFGEARICATELDSTIVVDPHFKDFPRKLVRIDRRDDRLTRRVNRTKSCVAQINVEALNRAAEAGPVN